MDAARQFPSSSARVEHSDASRTGRRVGLLWVIALAIASATVVGSPGARVANAYNGGASNSSPVTVSWPVNWNIDNTGSGLSGWGSRFNVTWYGFTTGANGGRYSLRANAPFDNTLQLTDASGNELASDDNSGGSNRALITYTFAGNTAYRIGFGSARSGDSGTGTMVVTKVAESTNTSVSFNPSSVAYPNSYTVYANVTSGSTVNEGYVAFYRDGDYVGSVGVSGDYASLSGEVFAPGWHTYTVNYLGTANYYASSDSNSIYVDYASQSVSVASPGDTNWSVGSISVSASASSGNPVELASNTTTVCTVSGLTVTLVTGGTCSLTASQAGDAHYSSAQTTQTFEVLDAPQTITFGSLADRIWSSSTFGLSATATSGLGVAFTGNTTDVCTVAGDTVTMLSAGTCSVTADQAGDSHFHAAPGVTQTFTITRAAQAEFTASSTSYHVTAGSTADLSTSGGSGSGAITWAITSGSSSCTVSGATLTGTAFGDCVATATKAADDRYRSASADSPTISVARRGAGSIQISGATTAKPTDEVTVTVRVAGLVNGLVPGEVALELSGVSAHASFTPASRAWTIADDGLSGTATFTVTAGDIGVLTVTPTMSISPAYAALASETSLGITVAKGDQTITFSPAGSALHATSPLTMEPTASSGLTVSLSSSTPSVCTVSGVSVTLVTGGVCTLTAAQAGNGVWNPADDVVRSIDITSAPQTVTFAPLSDRVWSATTFDVAPTASSGLSTALTSNTGSVCTVVGDTVTMLRTGTCSLSAAQAGNTWFAEATPVTTTFAITGAAQATLSAASSAYSPRLGTTADLSTTGGSGSGAITWQITSGGTNCSVSGSTLTGTHVGTCVATATKAGDTHYLAATAATATITVERAAMGDLAISGATTARPGQTVTVTVTATGLVDGLVPGDVSLTLSGASVGASVLPASSSWTVAGNGRSATADFSVTADAVGTLHIDASTVESAAYLAGHSAPYDIAVGSVTPTVNVTGAASIITGQPGIITVTVGGLVPGHLPGRVTPALHLTTTGTSISPAWASITPSAGGTSGTATFTLNTGVVGSLRIGASVAATTEYATAMDPSDLSVAVTPVPPVLHPVTATRVFDTRPGTPHGVRVVTKALIASGGVLRVKLTGLGSLVPASGVAAVSLNLTAVGASAVGYITAYPCGVRPTVSALNYVPASSMSNAAIVPVNASTGEVCFFAQNAVHLIADVNGWLASNVGFSAVGPRRVFDTRPTFADGIRVVPKRAVAAGTALTVKSTDLPGLVPATDVGSVVLNITTTSATAAGYITVFPCGARPAGVSSLTFRAGQTVAKTVVVPVNRTTGNLCFHTSATTHILVDISGWFRTGLGFTAAGPKHLFDTRPGQTGVVPVTARKVGGGYVLMVKVTGITGLVPATGVAAVSLDLTASEGAAAGSVTAFACGTRPPLANLHFLAASTRTNAVLAPVNRTTGMVCFHSTQLVNLRADISGWFLR